MKNLFEEMYTFINPAENPELKKVSEYREKELPTLWLLGKTGAGKSSLIQEVTKDSAIEIGNGFSPCTETAKSYDYPLEKPILRFLDTRGLSEAGYDPMEDIEVCRKGSHALIIMMKSDEVEQSDLVNALRKIKDISDIENLLIVHTNILSVSEKERDQAISYNQRQIEEVLDKEIKSVYVDFAPDDNTPIGISELNKATIEMLPSLKMFIDNEQHASREERNFDMLRNEIIWYSGSAGLSDALPGVGIISVPAIQGKMLHSLGKHYGVEWDLDTYKEFVGILGASFAWKYTVQFVIREGAKFIPVYGQTAGAGAAVVISSASTYAIGRIACKYLYHKSKGEEVSTEELTKLYEDAYDKRKEVADNEASKK